MEGNQMKMRDALVALRDAARNFYHQILNSKYSDIMDEYKCRERGLPALLDLRYTIQKANFAISAPPRQCDVGTAEEHAQRFYNFCESNSSGINGMCKPTCPCIDCFDKCQCFAKWAQMPYEDEEGGAK